MSRRRDSEIMFGSDSFLDIVANVVGILIILIVIAGVRVSQAPIKVKSSSLIPSIVEPAPSGELPPTAPLPPESDSAEPDPEPVLADLPPEPEPEPVSLNEPPPLPELAPPQELVDRARDLEAEIAMMKSETKSLNETLTAGNRQQSELEQRLQTVQSLLADRKDELAAASARTAEQKHDLELAKKAVARLRAQVKEEESKAPPAEKLEHRITPLGKTVTGRELHFRLDGNRVAEVPMEELIQRLKEHIERRKEWLMKTRQHKGQVGPVNGFSLEYVIGVETLSALEGLRVGTGGYRIGLRWWEIQPEDSLRGENEVEALSQGSRFYQTLLNADPESTLTFWVYPDSYPIFRKLQRFAHEHGFPVAARPLPRGIPIAGSPNGSRSSSQ